MGQNKRKLSGVFAPVVTPFHSDELALDDLRSNLRKLNETNLAGYLALGSNGEFRSLSDKEQIRILEVFAEEKGNKVVLVGPAVNPLSKRLRNQNWLSRWVLTT